MKIALAEIFRGTDIGASGKKDPKIGVRTIAITTIFRGTDISASEHFASAIFFQKKKDNRAKMA